MEDPSEGCSSAADQDHTHQLPVQTGAQQHGLNVQAEKFTDRTQGMHREGPELCCLPHSL